MFAVANFGSYTRNDNDVTSDKDLLVVSTGTAGANIVKGYEREGYSVSSYTPIQLHYMQRQGSLFLQHLRAEARIIFDIHNDLKRFLSDCHFIKPTAHEIEKCERSISFILAWPNSEHLVAWKIDCLYCLLRDYLIKILASQSILAFGMNDIIRQASMTFKIPSSMFGAFRQARIIKRMFRSGINSAAPGSQEVIEHLSALLKKLIPTLSEKNCDDINYRTGLVINENLSNYLLLRSLEAIDLTLENLNVHYKCRERILQLTQHPNSYNSTSTFRRAEILNLLDDLVLTWSKHCITKTIFTRPESV